MAEVSKESVNVRAGPNTNFEKIDKLNKGDQVVVLGRSYEWFKVQPLSTTNAYIRSDYLKIKDGEDLAVVLGDNVNVRCRASSDAASLGEVKKGALVKVLGREKEWCRLAPVAGTVTWIHQDFLKEISADVPASKLIPVIQAPPVDATRAPPKAVERTQDKETAEHEDLLKKASSAVSPWVSMRGKVETLVQSPNAGVHYEIVLDDKSVFFLQDIPQISYFCNTMVNVDGAIVPDPGKKFMYPLLHINKIALVL